MFQSSPAPKDGRYNKHAAAVMRVDLFQSSPAPKDGRYPLGAAGDSAGGAVSILARPEGRALPALGLYAAHAGQRFNPRPPRRTGATMR